MREKGLFVGLTQRMDFSFITREEEERGEQEKFEKKRNVTFNP